MSPPALFALFLGTLDAASFESDTTYGRIEGELTIAAGAGATVGGGGTRATGDLRLRYLDSAGVFISYEDALSAGAIAPARVLAWGLELRPLFLSRWLKGLEFANRMPDLVLDSLGLEVGAFVSQPPAGALGDTRGASFGMGIEVPVSGAATGLWMAFHGGFRWSETALARSSNENGDRSLFLSITLSWHQVVPLARSRDNTLTL